MNLNDMKRIAGIPQNDDLAILDEAVEIPADASLEHVSKMLDAAKRAMSIAHKLKDPADKKKHFSRVLSGMNKLRHHLKKMGATEPAQKVKKLKVKLKKVVADAKKAD